jgi:hypothetical protein
MGVLGTPTAQASLGALCVLRPSTPMPPVQERTRANETGTCSTISISNPSRAATRRG